MTEERGDLSKLMKEELRKALLGPRKGKTMEETIIQINREIEDRKIEEAKWSKKE